MNQSDFECLQELEKCFLGKKQLPKETVVVNPYQSYEISPINNISSILFPMSVINNENIFLNYSSESLQLIKKRNVELTKLLKKLIDSESSHQFLSLLKPSTSENLTDSSELSS
jgi:hypothetical protein